MTASLPDPLLERLRTATAGEYEIVRELGRGGFAAVFLARDIGLERDVAIKVLTQQPLADEVTISGEIERFRREARTVARLNHPNIVPVYAVRTTSGLQYFVMKFIKGRSLERVLEGSGALPIALVQAILQQAGSALAFAHRHGVVHRDIKPGNIMLDEDGWAVVADFGIAKVAQAEKLTGTGLIIGTAAYMSPEQWAGQEVGGHSDQYSLGVVAYELLTGRSPFAGETIPAMLWAHLNEVPPPVTDLRPSCPEPLAALVTRMIEKDPAARFPTLDAMLAALAALPSPEAAEAVRTQLMTLAMVSGAQLEVTQAASGERVVSGGAVTPSGRVARLTVTPAATTLATGATLRVAVTALNDTGRQLARRAIAWRSADERVATVDADGVVSGRGVGRTTVIASCEGAEAQVALEVTGARAATAVLPRRRAGLVATLVTATALSAGVLAWQQGLIGGSRSAPATHADSGLTADSQPGLATGAADSALGTGPAQADPTRRGIAPPPTGKDDRAAAREGPLLPADPRASRADPTAGAQGAARDGAAGTPNAAPNTAPTTLPNAPTAGKSDAGAGAEPNRGQPADPPGSRPTDTKAAEPTAGAPEARDEAPPANPAVEVSAGGSETCAALSSGDRVLCWGGASPTGSVLADVYFTVLAVGGGHICGLTSEGAAYCWGDNSQGQLGDGSRTARATPTPVRATVRFTDISVGASHTCALGADGSAWCWGANKAGQLGDNSIDTRTRPVLVRGREAFQSLSAGGSHTCGVRATKVYCWGDGFSGQIGNAIQENQREPFPVRTALPFRSVVTGELHTCGLTTSGRAWCWGENRNGQLGNETRDNRDVPDSVATDLVFTQLAAGARHTCGITSARQLACWGENGAGQLGDGTRQRREVPVLVARATQWKSVSTGAAHTCGITRADVVMCWGANSRGQVGSGATSAMLLVPTPIQVGPRGGP